MLAGGSIDINFSKFDFDGNFFCDIAHNMREKMRYQWPANNNIRQTQLLSRPLPNSCELFALDAQRF